LSDRIVSVAALKERVKDFVHRRNWEGYHNPKDLAESICIEAAELLEIFQWMPVEKALALKNNPTKLKRVAEELADTLIYCFSMANAMELDVSSIVAQKLVSNNAKYPVDKYGKKGSRAAA
jgi:NTP pyrophosphatase (non-canonical NTP hydrolase)